jgi:5'-methylthioadenosine phosphorylase
MSGSARAEFAVIGGSGFYDMPGVDGLEEIAVETPFGAPSDRVAIGTLSGRRVAFLPRHGVGHRILPGELPQRANIWALKSLGVERVISVSAVGSLKEEIAPLDMVIPDQLIDRTGGNRPATFFGRGLVAHIAFDEPFCGPMSAVLHAAVEASPARAHSGGTMVVIEGPAFSTRAESELYRSWRADVIGMTAVPEAKLAREAGLCYATLACVTDYDTWHDSHGAVTADMIIDNLRHNVAVAREIVARAIADAPAERACGCARALESALVTPLHLVPDNVKRDLAPILAPYLQPQEPVR